MSRIREREKLNIALDEYIDSRINDDFDLTNLERNRIYSSFHLFLNTMGRIIENRESIQLKGHQNNE